MIVLLTNVLITYAQNANDDSYYKEVKTYVNPVLPGDHPDPTLLKVGNDFYHCGSSFHFTPYLPIYHSTDLVHWQVISRVVYPSNAAFVTDRPSAGIWQGALTYFYGSYWIYFSANGQWFSKADSPKGPWSTAVQLKTNSRTGSLGYDNSIFVDDDGKPYMLIKNGQRINRIQALGKDGQLADTVINLDWINAKLQYSWAEGPVMCKRNGYYYYFPAGDVTGGQYVLRSTVLTSDSTKWERLGDFFEPVTDPETGFRRPNHISAPVELADGTWWTIGQSYEKYDHDDWSGTGRQTSLYQVTWKDNRPWGTAPTSKPLVSPDLPSSHIPWRTVHSDHFDNDALNLWWHFLSRKAASRYLLSARKGWLRLLPDTGLAHIVQKETDHYYTTLTRVDFNAKDSFSKAGIYLTSGNEHVIVRLFSGFDNGKKIFFTFDSVRLSIDNKFGNIIWLRVQRVAHDLIGSYSADGHRWVTVGTINVAKLDKAQPNFNSWVGTSVGLFSEGKSADFDLLIYKDAFSPIPAAGYNNYYGVKRSNQVKEEMVTNDSPKGGWFMISGVDFGKESITSVELEALSRVSGKKVEIWVDDLANGTMIASIPVTATKGNWKTIRASVKKVSGQHDLFVKFPEGEAEEMLIKSIQFIK